MLSGTVVALLALTLVPTGAAGGAGRELVIADGTTARPGREVNDVVAIGIRVVDEALAVEVRFRRPFAEMMFECVEMRIDGDDDPKTGLDGDELLIHAFVGSRFRPNAARPGPEGGKAPLELRHTAYAVVVDEERGVERAGAKSWLWRGELDPPAVDGERMRFAVPLSLLRSHGLHYNRFVPVSFRVEGTASEHPIPLRIVAADEGIAVDVDGKPDDWSGGVRLDDDPDELHPDAADLDILSSQLDYDADSLFAAVRLQGKHFGTGAGPGDDVTDEDRIVFAIEPLGRDYESVREYEVRAADPVVDGPEFRARVQNGFLECAIARTPAQTAYRVVVWADAIRVDRVPDSGVVRVDTVPGKGR